MRGLVLNFFARFQMKVKTPKRGPTANTPAMKIAKRRSSAGLPAESNDLPIQRVPPKSVSKLQVRYVHGGKGLPRAYRLDD
jgi:hypothetical protein